MHIIRYRLYPNNELRAVHYYSNPSKKGQVSDASVEQTPATSETASSPEAESLGESSLLLDISNDFRQCEKRLSHKKTRFGTNAKNTLLRTGGAYDTLSTEPSDFVFLTGTLPGSTTDAMWAIAEYSAYIAESINKWIKRTVQSDYYFYVWELQKRGALHFHYCVYAADEGVRAKILADFKPKWTSLLDDISERAGTCMWSAPDDTCWRDRYGTLQAYAQTVHTSVAAYLSGYLGGNKDKHAQDADSPYYPSRWWGSSRASSSLLKGLTQEVSVEHTNYRSARYEMQVHYERVLHDSPKAHHYPHKVGIGSTVVSYHPEDKGNSQWLLLNPMLYKPQSHPNTVSTIRLYRTLSLETQCLLEASPKQTRSLYRQLLTTLRGLCFPEPVYGFSISRADLAIILSIPSTLDSTLVTISDWERLRIQWCLLQDSLREALPKLYSDKHGYISNDTDCLKLLDNHWSARYIGTTTPKGEDAVSGHELNLVPSKGHTQTCLFPLTSFQQAQQHST